MKKLTTSEFKTRLKNSGIEFTLVDEYCGSHTKITFQCNEGHRWTASPNNILHGSGCPRCANQFPLTFDIINERLRSRNIQMIDVYANANHKTTFMCDKFHTWRAKPGNVLHGQGCPKCAGIFPLNKELINERLTERGIVLLDEYVNNRTKALFRCNNNHEWSTRPNTVLNGSGCPSCMSCGFNPNKPAWGYLLNFGLFLKVGITNYLDQRLYQHSIYNGDHTILANKYFENGKNALEWEKSIIYKFSGRYVSKDVCPDGWTETLPLLLKDNLIQSLI